jgi:hypothetical protein
VSTQEGGTLEGWQWNLAVNERVRWPWRRIAVPGEGLANTKVKHTHEHRCATGSRSVYLSGLENPWRELSTTESSSGGSGERRLGVKANPVGTGLDQVEELGKKVEEQLVK